MSKTKAKDQSRRGDAYKKGNNKTQYNYRPNSHQYKKNPEEIPVLRFGPGNNFHKFKETLSKAALRLFGLVGKLIDLEKKYVPPVPTRADFQLMDDPADDETLFQEAVKGRTKVNIELRMKEPMLYAMIWQYLSPESMDEIKHDEDYKTLSDGNDPEGLWLAIIKTHKVSTVSRVKGVIKRSSRRQYQSIGMAAETIEPPSDVNTVYKLAHQWVKTQTIQKGNSAATIVTSIDIAHADTDKKDHKVNVTKGKRDGGRDNGREGPSNDRVKDIMCYNCQEKGHYANKCPKKKQVALTQADHQDNDSGSAHVTWHAATFETIREVSVNNVVDSSNMLNRNKYYWTMKPTLVLSIQTCSRTLKRPITNLRSTVSAVTN
jgi:hypothetical protein